jgi:hypothetical protein
MIYNWEDEDNLAWLEANLFKDPAVWYAWLEFEAWCSTQD